eukprot:scaffold273_cov89-Cylindrotheca_fusiformis.AAC.1
MSWFEQYNRQTPVHIPTHSCHPCWADAVYAHCARVTATLRTDDVHTAYVTSGIHTTYADIRS